jgi:DNA replication protein DnaC
LLGPPGVGKTHIAVALAVAACRAGYSIYFTSLDDMVRNLKTAEETGRLTSKLGTYLRPSVLVVDEVGYQPLERAEANLVFQVISKRYEKGSIILTSNKTFSKAHMFRRTCARQRRNGTGSALLGRVISRRQRRDIPRVAPGSPGSRYSNLPAGCRPRLHSPRRRGSDHRCQKGPGSSRSIA